MASIHTKAASCNTSPCTSPLPFTTDSSTNTGNFNNNYTSDNNSSSNNRGKQNRTETYRLQRRTWNSEETQDDNQSTGERRHTSTAKERPHKSMSLSVVAAYARAPSPVSLHNNNQSHRRTRSNSIDTQRQFINRTSPKKYSFAKAKFYRKKKVLVDASTQTTSDVATQTSDNEQSTTSSQSQGTQMSGAPSPVPLLDNPLPPKKETRDTSIGVSFNDPIQTVIQFSPPPSPLASPSMAAPSTFIPSPVAVRRFKTPNVSAGNTIPAGTSSVDDGPYRTLFGSKSDSVLADLNDLEEEIAIMRYKALTLKESIKWMERERMARPKNPVLGDGFIVEEQGIDTPEGSSASEPNSETEQDHSFSQSGPARLPSHVSSRYNFEIPDFSHTNIHAFPRSRTPGPRAKPTEFTNSKPTPSPDASLSIPAILKVSSSEQDNVACVVKSPDQTKSTRLGGTGSAFSKSSVRLNRLTDTRMSKSLTALPDLKL